jgi:MOSC domain-containing protein YiiM
MLLTSIQLGQPRTVGIPGASDPLDRSFTSAIWKEPVPGPVWAGALGLEGDAVANTAAPIRQC